MIVVDIETSGVDFTKNGIWQIGAVELETGEIFFEESRIDEEDLLLNSEEYDQPTIFEVIGKTEKELREKNKQSQKQMIENFLSWASQFKINNLICNNPQFDLAFILTKARKYKLKIPFHYRAIDLHTLSQVKFFEINKKFNENIEKNKLGFDLTEILKFCGIKDNRGKHNALEDAKLTAECFNRLVYGKNLIEEFKEFRIPDYLRK